MKRSGNKQFLALLDEMKRIHIAKSLGYTGKSDDPWVNFRSAMSFGVSPILSVFIRMSDKWARLISLVEDPNHDVIGEALEDTLIDLASYALIAICLIKELKVKSKRRRK
jgi:hypothetical protein